ncbi:unnamed protein product, partial [Mesorhabditis belari]|uniref:G protein-coupled receptor n=1 Tax=Mesorhabditis belari TaxID=2138241 RepID=A0AAF3F5B1_9BILA
MSSKCARGPMTVNSLDYYMQHYVFPVQIIGFFVLAFMVLYNVFQGRTKHVAQVSLCVLAVVDILIFGCLMPQSMGSFKFLYENEDFRRFNQMSKIRFYAFSNQLSAVDTSIFMLIIIEIYLRAKNSSLTKVLFGGKSVWLCLGVGILGALLCSSFHHFSYSTKIWFNCSDENGENSKMFSKLMMNPEYMTRELFIWLHMGSALFLIFIPTIIIYYLTRKVIVMLKEGKGGDPTNEAMELFSSSEGLSQQRRKITIYLPAVAHCFALTHILSIVPFAWDIFLFKIIGFTGYSVTISIMNSLLIAGKIANFGLLYLSCVEMGRNGLLTSF